MTLPEQETPRLLGRKRAAAYVGLSANTFDAEVAKGNFPAPVKLACKRKLWDRVALDRKLDQMSGFTPASDSAQWLARFPGGDKVALRYRNP